jgi:hypothetical protein
MLWAPPGPCCPSNNGAMASSALRSRKFSALADTYGGVLSRDLLRQFGADRNVISRQVANARWSLVGQQTVAMHTAALSPLAHAWRAVWEVGGEDVALDGVSSLQMAGLSGFDTSVIDVSIPWRARVGAVPGVRIPSGVPRYWRRDRARATSRGDCSGDCSGGALGQLRPASGTSACSAHSAADDHS